MSGWTERTVKAASVAVAGLVMFSGPAHLAYADSPGSLALPTTVSPLDPGAGLSSRAAYAFTGAEQTFTVPPGVDSLNVTLVGGRGGKTSNVACIRTAAGRVDATVAVRPGQVLTIAVGGDGIADHGNRAPGAGGWSTKEVRGDAEYDFSGGHGGGGHGSQTQDGSGGGGASVLKLDDRTVLVAGGSGGQGGAPTKADFGWCGGAGGALAAVQDEAPGSDGDHRNGNTGSEGGRADRSGADRNGGSESSKVLLSGGGGGGGGGEHFGAGGTKSAAPGGGGGGGGGSSWADPATASNVKFSMADGAEIELDWT